MPTSSLRFQRGALILLGLLLTALYAYGHFIDGDVIQLLEHGHRLVTQGEVVPYGPHSSSGSSGRVPGSFLSLAVGLPMLIWHSPWMSLGFLALLHLLALFMLMDVLRNFVKPQTLLFVVVAYWLNPYRASEVFLWNPGYMYFAAVLHMWTAFKCSQGKSWPWSALHVASLFLAIQIHPSAVILGLGSLLLLWRGQVRVSWPGFGLGMVLGVASLIPFFLEMLTNEAIVPRAGNKGKEGYLFFALLNVYPFLKGIWYWVLFGATIPPSHVFHQTGFTWLEPAGWDGVIKTLWTAIKYIVGVGGVLLSFYVHNQFWRKVKKGEQGWLYQYVLTAALASLVALAILPTTPQYWHLLYIFPAALVPVILFVDDHWQWSWRRVTTRHLVWTCALYFVASNLLAAIESRKHKVFETNFHQLYHEQLGRPSSNP